MVCPQVAYTIVWMAMCSEMGYYRNLYGPSVLLLVRHPWSVL